ncbi:MAG: ABC transporter permease [Planctomycetota bacterium]
MLRFVLRRLATLPLVLLAIVAITFVMVRMAPGGPFTGEKNIPPETQAAQMKYWGLDQPIEVQFVRYVGNLCKGDLGPSFKYKDRTVNSIIADSWKPSAVLGGTALLIAVAIGISAGLIAGLKQNSRYDYVSMAIAMVGISLPTFVVGPFLVILFAFTIPIFNVSGWEVFPRDLILPAITLALPYTARIARLTRAGMLEVVNQDYIRTARAKGLHESIVVTRHALRGALLPVVSFLGPALAFIMTGSLVVEQIFTIPGLGRQFVLSALNRDYTLTQGLVILTGSLLILANLAVDVIYGYLDPRIRYE